MIEIDVFRGASATTAPIRHAEICRPISLAGGRVLLADMVTEGFFRSSRADGSDKTYRVVNNVLFTLEDQAMRPGLPAPWRELVDDLTSDAYTEAVSVLLDMSLTDCPREITLKRYLHGDFISMHTDSAAVRATHLIFLNQCWQESWGGLFCFHDKTGAICRSFLPVLDSSVVFARSSTSWHSVTPVETKDAERIAIQVVFWNDRTRHVAPGRREEPWMSPGSGSPA